MNSRLSYHSSLVLVDVIRSGPWVYMPPPSEGHPGHDLTEKELYTIFTQGLNDAKPQLVVTPKKRMGIVPNEQKPRRETPQISTRPVSTKDPRGPAYLYYHTPTLLTHWPPKPPSSAGCARQGSSPPAPGIPIQTN